ncbi:MAG: uracil-DNA glycosylase [Acidobacteria bacterium]|nr:MAG: uracil-DNA glycosylase [Acidobacteriota bacterium]
MGSRSIAKTSEQVESCGKCPRLVKWREAVAAEKRAAFAGETYWGKAVPGFGDPDAWLMIIGLAPAAHGANRTGRMFTGDRSGEWLYGALYRADLSSAPRSVARDDGLDLTGVYVTSVVKCAPPANKPTPAERDECTRYLVDELAAISPSVVVALGKFAWDGLLRALSQAGSDLPSPRPRFAHLAEIELAGPRRGATLIGSFHPSQQNTFTGKLTSEMFDAVFARALAVGRGAGTQV